MVKILLDFLGFLNSCAPLLVSVGVLTLLCVRLSKSIKKRSAVYYIIFCIPFLMVAIPSICRWFGLDVMSFTGLPVLGQILRECYIHMSAFGHPLLIVIMYMGALDPKIPAVNKLMKVRKELSIISGFVVFTHSIIRITGNFPGALRFFTNHEGYMESTRVTSELGAGISSFSFVLGVIMLIIFIPLWVTSFDSAHRRMGNVKWKKLQKWSYVLYATLFIHAMGIQIGGMLNPRGGGGATATSPVAVEAAASGTQSRGDGQSGTGERQGGPERANAGQAAGERSGAGLPAAGNDRAGQAARPAEDGNPGGQGGQAVRSGGGRVQAKGFADFKVGSQTKQYINIISLILIYGSYLYLRVRKARKDAKKRTKPAKA